METLLNNAMQYVSQHPVGSAIIAIVGYYLLKKFFFTLAIMAILAVIGVEYYGK